MNPVKNTFQNFVGDLPKNFFAGFAVSLIALPLTLGLAIASGAPPMSGIIAAVVGGVLVAVLGGSHITITGPGNGLVVVLLGAITTLADNDLYQGYLYTLAAIVISGILMLLLGFLRMGALSNFFPSSAIQGMLAAIGIIILAKQFHIMLGNLDAEGTTLELLLSIPDSAIALFNDSVAAVRATAVVGLVSLLIMIFYARIRNRYFQLIPAPMWIVFLSVGMSYYYEYFPGVGHPITPDLLIDIPSDPLESLAHPDFSKITDTHFITTVIVITLIASIESLLSINAVDKLDPEKRRSNVNKDLKALGLATTVSGLIGGLNVVTVIARSSVNANNGGTNRSSNFFHAFFLVLFIIVFQEQLKKIPLSALAAILVYTGYKLAAPETLKRVFKIGKEQSVIFLVTLFITLVVNLISGIIAGILTTILIHFFITKNPLLFMRNIFKPNVLMFKESDGKYYTSVKDYCTFLNYYRLKRNLDVIPENQDVIVDFSLCDFVDHTVMESLNDYSIVFRGKGGNFEIVGLDMHDADTKHPFAIRKILPFSTYAKQPAFLTRRQKAIKDAATNLHWDYIKERVFDVGFLKNMFYFKTREIDHIYNICEDPNGRFKLFDIEFSEGRFIAKEEVRASMLYIRVKRRIPAFVLSEEGFLERLQSLAGYRPVKISGHKDFSRRFYLWGEDTKAIKTFFSDALVFFFESNPYYHIESDGQGILIMNNERLAAVKEIKEMADFGIRMEKILKVCP